MTATIAAHLGASAPVVVDGAALQLPDLRKQLLHVSRGAGRGATSAADHGNVLLAHQSITEGRARSRAMHGPRVQDGRMMLRQTLMSSFDTP